MNKFPSVTGTELIKALSKVGFAPVRVKGSHHWIKHPDGRGTTIPVHGKETLGPGLLLKILRDIDLSREDIRELL